MLYRILKRLFGRMFFLILSVLFQILWFSAFMALLGARYPVFAGFVRVLSVAAVLYIIGRRANPSYNLAWSILILMLPVVGISVYLMFGRSRMARNVGERYDEAVRATASLLSEDEGARDALSSLDPQINRQSLYLRDAAGFPVWEHTRTEYYPNGELLYESLIRELDKAERFIFMEYFIIDSGVMWETILDILERKAAAGVDVRIIYDDVGCVNTLPEKFYRDLRARGIACEVFNPFHPVVAVVLNNRDHRKITVIDGCVGFTGGINLADEYINKKKRFGYWKDSGVMIRGEAVRSFTVMFLQMWSVVTKQRLTAEDQLPFMPDPAVCRSQESDGFVQPYSNTPLGAAAVGEGNYLNIISSARRYVYIFTPYLIVGNEMITSLCLAARSGVDVRIVMPGIPDKKWIYMLSRAYYEQLIEAGVRIFEYTPGFLHAKSFVCDDEVASVGTINMDFRSLYLHFECGVWMYKSSAVMQLRRDADRVLADAREITLEECRSTPFTVRLLQSILRLAAPML